MTWTLFNFLYRDASNFKSFGCVALEGNINSADRETVRGKLEGGEYFIAEQVGVRPLYEQLYRWSDGPTASDHCWHEFAGFRESAELPKNCAQGGRADAFVRRFASVQDWDLSRSVHYQSD